MSWCRTTIVNKSEAPPLREHLNNFGWVWGVRWTTELSVRFARYECWQLEHIQTYQFQVTQLYSSNEPNRVSLGFGGEGGCHTPVEEIQEIGMSPLIHQCVCSSSRTTYFRSPPRWGCWRRHMMTHTKEPVGHVIVSFPIPWRVLPSHCPGSVVRGH